MERPGLRAAFVALLVFITLVSLVNMYNDHGGGRITVHVISEVLTLIAAVVGLFLVWRFMGARLERAHEELSSARHELEGFRQRHGDTLKHMREAVQEQFERWKFSPAEKQIAELLIRGYSLKQIAGLLGKSERTVRNQTTALYDKAGMVGRTELAAFFFMDVLGESELE